MLGSSSVLDTTGEVCPVPLIRFRRELEKLGKDEVLEVIGTHEASRNDIIVAAKELRMELIKVETDRDGRWHIFVRKAQSDK